MDQYQIEIQDGRIMIPLNGLGCLVVDRINSIKPKPDGFFSILSRRDQSTSLFVLILLN